jgi:hypothetical protein
MAENFEKTLQSMGKQYGLNVNETIGILNDFSTLKTICFDVLTAKNQELNHNNMASCLEKFKYMASQYESIKNKIE